MANAQVETVQTDGFAMDYIRLGEGERPFVILPGLSVQSITNLAREIAASYASMANDFTIYVIDRRKELPPTYPLAQMAEDTAAAIQALGLAPVALFGASQGGMLAMSIAAEHPELVSKLILGSTSPCMGPAQYQIVEDWIQMARDGDAAALYCSFGEAIYPERIYAQLREYLLVCAEQVTREELDRFVILAGSMRGFDVRERLHNIACPVLLLGSLDDRVLDAKATEEIATHLGERASYEMHLYDGYGHAAYDIAPDYKERMLRFLNAESSE